MSNLELAFIVINCLLLGFTSLGAFVIYCDWQARKNLMGQIEVLRSEFQMILKQVKDLNNANAKVIVELTDRVQGHEMMLKGIGSKR